MFHIHHVIVAVLVGWIPQAPASKPDLAGEELTRQQGTWLAVSSRRDGADAPGEIVRSITRNVEKDHVIWKRDGKNFAGTSLVLDPTQKLPALDAIPDGGPARGKRVLGIYKLEGDRLTICMADPDRPRPTEFKAEKGSRQTLMVFTRAKPAAGARP
ncbi:MAG: TIGR03067 domain-containing protein [Isosphaeraceae bacterium]